MADIKFVREYQIVPGVTSTQYDVLYAKSNRLCTYMAEDLPKTVQKWLEDKVGTTQHSNILGRDEIIYKAEPKYRVEFDFRFNGEDVHAHLDNNGKGFCEEDAVRVGKELAAQGNRHVMVIAI